MLSDAKARKDGAVVKTVVVEDDKRSTNFDLQRMTMASIDQKKRIKRVVEYGLYIATLVRLLEEGYFE